MCQVYPCPVPDIRLDEAKRRGRTIQFLGISELGIRLARGIDTPATGDGGASGRGGSRFWPRSAAPLGKAALAARRRRIFFHYWAVQIAHPPSENRGDVMLCHRLHPATILRVLSAFFALLLSLSCAGLCLLKLQSW